MSQSIPKEDKISSLPDPILYHILSFLPTKFAATTSILSKRWNPLWLFVPTLHFDDSPFKDYISFRHFVSTVFLSRDITLPIRSFHLKCSKHQSDANDINRFVNAAMQRGGIENLNLNMFSRLSLKVKLLATIFSCKTLVVLQLRGVKVNDVILDLPRIKTLHLSSVSFQSVEYLTKFLSRCLILEELHLKCLLIDREEELVLEENFQCLPNLIRANITNGLFFRLGVDVLLFTLCCKAEVLHAQLDMKYLNTRYHQFPMCHNLIYMELILDNNHSEKWNWLLEVLNHCPKIQNLTIHEYSRLGNENLDNWTDPAIVPECLSTQLRTCLLKGYRNTECEIQFAKYIMQNSKVLNNMSIKSAYYLDLNAKHQMITKLASSKRASTTCELFFH